jgi:hypothetical protein
MKNSRERRREKFLYTNAVAEAEARGLDRVRAVSALHAASHNTTTDKICPCGADTVVERVHPDLGGRLRRHCGEKDCAPDSSRTRDSFSRKEYTPDVREG